MRENAKIIARSGDTLQCVVECGDACSSCAARKVCAPGAADGNNIKTITLLSSDVRHQVGDTITLEISEAMGLRAVLLAYLIPVALIIGLLLILQGYGLSDLLSGGIVLGAAALYFLAIKVFGLSRTISVEIVEPYAEVDSERRDKKKEE